MTRAAPLLSAVITAALLLGAAPASAQRDGIEGPGDLSEPPEGRPARPGLPNWPTSPPSSDSEAAGEAEPVEQPLPRVQLGYTHYALVDGFGGGDVNAGVFGGFLPFGPFRVALSAELGSRTYALAQNDFLARAVLGLGYRHLGLGRFVPYGGAVLTVGVAVGKRFRTPVTEGFAGGGIELGADVRVAGPVFLGLGLSYQRIAMGNAGRDLWSLRLYLAL